MSEQLDELMEQLFPQPEESDEGDKLDYLIHQVFVQNQSGAELLERWKETLIMSPTVVPGSPPEVHAINEGLKTFIRNIYLTAKKVEGKL